jgi:hypothetical protein
VNIKAAGSKAISKTTPDNPESADRPDFPKPFILLNRTGKSARKQTGIRQSAL